jgi:hypothetical protein
MHAMIYETQEERRPKCGHCPFLELGTKHIYIPVYVVYAIATAS